MKPLLNTVQAARYLGLSKGTLYTMRNYGGGPKYQRAPNGRPIYALKMLDQFLKKRGKTAAMSVDEARTG